MKITVAVKPNSKKDKIEKINDYEYLVRVHAPPVDGKANERLIELLAEYFKTPKSRIELISGSKSKKKIFEIS